MDKTNIKKIAIIIGKPFHNEIFIIPMNNVKHLCIDKLDDEVSNISLHFEGIDDIESFSYDNMITPIERLDKIKDISHIELIGYKNSEVIYVPWHNSYETNNKYQINEIINYKEMKISVIKE